MKQVLLILAATLGIQHFAQARPIGSIEPARKLSAQLSEALSATPGVSRIGITGCHPRYGYQTLDGNFVYCVVITGDRPELVAALTQQFPAGRKVGGVFVVVRLGDRVVPHPRMSGGN